MLTLKCIGSGSNGNCYLLYCGEDVLVIDCGLSIGDIKRGLDYKITGIKGVLLTHGHLDHSYSLKDFRKMHIPVFTPHEKADKQIAKVEYGPFKIMALPLLDKEMQRWQHTNGDGSECPCYAFLIEADGQRILYVTDTKLLVWNVHKWNINHFLIGLNYMSERLSREEFKTRHIISGHMSLETCKQIVESNKTPNMQTVILCHLSQGNADSDKCIEEVKNVAGIARLDVAEGKKEWKLYGTNECPF